MRFEVNITKKSSFVFLSFLLVVIGVVFVVAGGHPNPGHDFPELVGVQAEIIEECPAGSAIRQINTDGTVVCEEDSIANSDIGEQNCYVVLPWLYPSIGWDGFYMKGFYKWTDGNWDGVGLMLCNSDPTTSIPNAIPAPDLHGLCNTEYGSSNLIQCNVNWPTVPVVSDYP